MTFDEMRDSVKGTPYQAVFGEVINRLELISDCIAGDLATADLKRAVQKQEAREAAEKAQAEVHAKIAADEQQRRKDKRTMQGAAI